MIDHLSLAVADIDRSRTFYDAVMATLGLDRLMNEETEHYVASGYGMAGSDEPGFWVGADAEAKPGSDAEVLAPVGQHIAFTARSRAQVDAFHAAGLAAGGRDNGAPGLRPHYHAHYYAGFLIDPDGHHIEAVCHAPA